MDGVLAGEPLLSGEGTVTMGPVGRAYSDSYLNDNWILVR